MGRLPHSLRHVFVGLVRCTLSLGMASHLTPPLVSILFDRSLRPGSFWTLPSPFLSNNLHGYRKTWP
jgi:hypothetical protein